MRDYFERNNAAARQGWVVQQNFLRRTQHPEFTGRTCELRGLTVELDPAMPTLRPDPDWSPGGEGNEPRGEVLVVAVGVTVRRDGAAVGNQVGSLHVVLLRGKVYGFAPCPT